MALTRRYQPSFSPSEVTVIGMDFSPLLPPGIGILPYSVESISIGLGGTLPARPTPRLEIWVNWPGDVVPAPEDWSVDGALAQVPWYWTFDAANPEVPAVWHQGPRPGGAAGFLALSLGVAVRGRKVYAVVSGGDPGVDYQFRWSVTDTHGYQWTRTGLMLCGETS
jgi:hypothetical protein